MTQQNVFNKIVMTNYAHNIYVGQALSGSEHRSRDQEAISEEVGLKKLKQILLAGQGSVQYGGVQISIGQATVVNIGGPPPDQVRLAVQKVLEEIERDSTLQGLMQYMDAVRASCAYPAYLSIASDQKTKFSYSPVFAKYKPDPAKSFGNGSNTPVETPLLPVEAPLLIGQQLASSPHVAVVVEGPSGAGKTSSLKRIAECAWQQPSMVGLPRPYLVMPVRLRHLAVSSGLGVEERLLNAVRVGNQLLIEGHPLKSGFMDAWSQIMDARWLLLLDAFDEVPRERMPELRLWLRRITEEEKFRDKFSLVFTSRQAATLGQSLLEDATVLQLTQLPKSSREEIASNILGKRSLQFNTEAKQRGFESALSTPLDVTLASIVYLKKGNLPRTRSHMIYDFVRMALQEAMAQQVKEEIDPSAAESIVEQLALHMFLADDSTRQRAIAVTEDILDGDLGGQARAARIVDVLGRRSGLFSIAGEQVVWAHALFLEFIAALAEARRTCMNPTQAALVAEEWLARSGRSLACGFFVAILSHPKSFDLVGATNLVDHVVSFLLGSESETSKETRLQRVLDVAFLFPEGLEVDTAIELSIVNELSSNSDILRRYDYCGRVHQTRDTIRAIVELGKIPRFSRHFGRLADLASAWIQGRDWSLAVDGMVVLAMIGRWDKLEEFVKSPSVDKSVVAGGCNAIRWVNDGEKREDLMRLAGLS